MKRIERKFRRILGVILAMSLCVTMLNISAFAASDTDNEGNEREVNWDDDYIYFHYSGSWSSWMNSEVYVSVPEGYMGQLSMIRIGQSNYSGTSSIEVRDSWSNIIEGASGTVINNGPMTDGNGNVYGYSDMEWTIQIPWSTYEDYNLSGLSMRWGNLNVNPTLDNLDPPSDDEPSGTEPEVIPTDPSDEEPINTDPTIDPNELISSGIVIDGNFDDWAPYPVTEITYTGNNGMDNHSAQLYSDGDNLYAHFVMADTYNGRMQIQRWYLTINDQQFVLLINSERNGNIDWSRGIPNGKGTHTGLKCFLGDNPQLMDSDVAYVIYTPGNNNNSQLGQNHKAQGDEIEFSISLEDLARLTGIPVEDMRTISIKNDNIGSAQVTTAGTSSGPIIGVAICVVAAVGGYIIYRKKKSKQET